MGSLLVLSDTSAQHSGGFNDSSSFQLSSGVLFTPTVDFSAAWTAYIYCRSVNEVPINLTGATWAGGIATFTGVNTALTTGDKTTVAGVTPSGYNGVHIVTRIDSNTFTAPIASDPGTYTSGGTSSRISNMVSESYVLEWKG